MNVASHLLIEVLEHRIDAAIVYSNDSDLHYPLEQARLRVPVGTVNPGTKATCAALRAISSGGIGRHWWRRLTASDFTMNQLPAALGAVTRPVGW